MKRLLVLGPFLSLGLVLVVLWTLVGWFAVIYPASLVQEVQDDLANTAAAASQETDALLREAETQLRTLDLMLLTRRTDQTGQDATVSQLVDTLRESARGITDVMLAHTDGRVWRIPSNSRAAYAELGPDSVLHELTVPGARHVVIGAPIRLRPGAHEVLPMATRLSVDSSEQNAAIAFLDLDHLQRVYRARMLRPGLAVFLERSDGLALLRQPGVTGLEGTNIPKNHPAQALPASAPTNGQFTLLEGLDGRERVVAYRTLDGYPLRIFVSLERERVLAGYLSQRRAVLGFSFLVTVIALGLTVWLTRLQHRTRLAEAEREATADASPMGLFRADLEGRTVYANETYLALLELDESQLAWGWLDRLPPAERDAVRADWLARAQRGESMDRVRRMVRSDGSDLVLAVRTRPMRVNDRIVAFAGTVLDITEPARQQETARMLSAIIDLAPDYIAQTTMDGDILYLNPALRRRLGLAPDAPLDGLHRRQFFVDGGEARFHDEILPAAARDGHWSGRWLARTRTGQSLPVDCTLILHRDETSTQVRTVSWILRDISVELAIERERERSQAVMNALAQSVSVMMLAVDSEEQVLFCNRAFEQQLGISPRSWEGQTARDLLGHARYADTQPLIARALAGESTLAELRDDGPDTVRDDRIEPRYLELSYAPLRGETGAIIGAFGVVRDVTEVKQEQLRLLKASNTDPLTELLNRSGFAAHVHTGLQRARDRQELVALLYLDLDRFKPVNDDHGHPVGDALLKAVAGRLRHALRPQDLVARLGGDEFAVFLHQVAKPEDAQSVGDKLVNTLSMPFRIGALELHIGTSVGFCVQWAAQATVDDLVTQADAQLYRAKRGGRGRAEGSVCESPGPGPSPDPGPDPEPSEGDLNPAPLTPAA
ncbi:diguanylate cyclase domain-containing protein [Roseateles amylovorans]|uniref:Diguanylate cyclase n=1 Tax=Roseateles amylovorans TaxID=2978473 RepID=A0ABY6AXT1_9BURK|nr:diguanylate cyclase [Roseateles amylovorans]UXH77787.1 diguanylate cyclase [Roseateles amylovorans]